MVAKRWLVGVVVTGLLGTAGIAGAGAAVAAAPVETKVVYASDDTYTSSTRVNSTFGANGQLLVGRVDGESLASYVKFSTGALPAGAQVTAAAIRFPLASAPARARFTLYPVAAGWAEGSLTAAKAPALGAGPVTIEAKSGDTALRFDVSKWVKQAGTYAFALRTASLTTVTKVRSVEYGDPKSGGPELSVTYARTAAMPATPATTSPATTSPAVPAQPCVTGALLVPTCGVLWGAAAGGFSEAPRDRALLDWESITGRTATVFHAYHRGDELFPTKSEIAMTRDPARPRVLLLNWKVAYGTNWAKVAAGAKDARIDRWAAHVKANFPQKFFLVLHHEPENDVNPNAGSGMTAKDYAAMYRHVIQRLRAKGVPNAVNVLGYMGNEKWMSQSWWKDIYPGDDVVDWLGLDSYVSVERDLYHYGDFGDLLDRPTATGGPGWYEWAVTTHPAKPIMIAEWGMYHRTKVKTDKSPAFNSVLPELAKHPKIKAIVYFDTEEDNEGDRNISVNSLPSSLAAFRKVAASPIFNVTPRP